MGEGSSLSQTMKWVIEMFRPGHVGKEVGSWAHGCWAPGGGWGPALLHSGPWDSRGPNSSSVALHDPHLSQGAQGRLACAPPLLRLASGVV